MLKVYGMTLMCYIYTYVSWFKNWLPITRLIMTFMRGNIIRVMLYFELCPHIDFG